MSDISDLLWLKAKELNEAASNTSTEWQMTKSAAVSSLESKGINKDDAENLLEKLAERSYPNLKADLEKAAQLIEISKMLEKSAEYISELEVKLSTKEDEIEGLKKSASMVEKAPSVDALSGTGAFTSEDLETLRQLEGDTLNKVASLADRKPWNLGGPSEHISSSATGDALTEFLTS